MADINECVGCNAENNYGFPGIRPHANLKDRVEACLECNRYGDDIAAALTLALKLGTTMETRTVELDGLPIQSFFVKGVKLSDNDKKVIK